jgi:hypothetical protein
MLETIASQLEAEITLLQALKLREADVPGAFLNSKEFTY